MARLRVRLAALLQPRPERRACEVDLDLVLDGERRGRGRPIETGKLLEESLPDAAFEAVHADESGRVFCPEQVLRDLVPRLEVAGPGAPDADPDIRRQARRLSAPKAGQVARVDAGVQRALGAVGRPVEHVLSWNGKAMRGNENPGHRCEKQGVQSGTRKNALQNRDSHYTGCPTSRLNSRG